MTVHPEDRPRRQPIFNLPRVMLILIGIFLGIQLVCMYLLSPTQFEWVIVNFAFIPARFTGFEGVALTVEALPGAGVWTFVTYAFLHSDWAHLLVNGVWMTAFGSPLAWRFGAGRFLAFSAAGAIAGAGVHLVFHWGDVAPMVGASAAISAHMAGASRFLFLGQGGGLRTYHAPAAPLRQVFTDRRTLMFLLVWFGTNLAVGLLGIGTSEGTTIAWEAHIGGFVAGLLLFPLLDPVPKAPEPPRDREDRAAS